MRTSFATKSGSRQHAHVDTVSGFRGKSLELETCRYTSSKNRRKTLQDCKEAIIAHVRVHPDCCIADLVKIASRNGVKTTSNSVATKLCRLRKQDSTIPKLAYRK